MSERLIASQMMMDGTRTAGSAAGSASGPQIVWGTVLLLSVRLARLIHPSNTTLLSQAMCFTLPSSLQTLKSGFMVRVCFIYRRREEDELRRKKLQK